MFGSVSKNSPNVESSVPLHYIPRRKITRSNHLNQDKESCQRVLTSLRKDNPDRLIFAQLNINSIRNKFDYLSDLVKGKVDVLLISETKIDDSFPKGQFLIQGFISAPYRLDRNCQGGGLMLFVIQFSQK